MRKLISLKKLKIGIDIDNVISDTFRNLMGRFNSAYTKKVQFEEIFDFYYFEKYAGVGRKQVKIFIEKVFHSEEFHDTLTPYQEAIDVIKTWSKLGYLIHYVTARPTTTREQTKKWLTQHGFMVPYSTLDLLDMKKYKDDIIFKTEVVETKGIDIMIEDSREIARAMKIPVFLFDRPWNKGKMPKNVRRVTSWNEINKLISYRSYSVCHSGDPELVEGDSRIIE